MTILPPGTKVGRYEIVRLIGEGGMSVVYEALDARLNRKVALKVLPSSSRCKRKAAKRFAIEAQAAARLDHPNVVRLYDFDMACDIPYMAMELLEGSTLSSAIVRGPLAVERTADIMLAVCAGVFAAHRAGIVHRDLKPSNIFLCKGWSGRATARVLDFGISKVCGVSSSDLTQTGDIVGTSQYLSPEQASGQRHITEASDQYALGVVMYECVTQRTPQPSGLPMYDLLRRVAAGRHDPLSALRPDLPPAFTAIIERAMSVSPENRYRSVHELGRALFPFASAECHCQYDDYFRMGSTPAEASPCRREHQSVEAPTLEQPEPPVPAWQSEETRTSVRRDPRRRSGPGRMPVASTEGPTSRKMAYSVAIGAVVAAAVLGGLLLAFHL